MSVEWFDLIYVSQFGVRSMSAIAEIAARVEKATPGPWTAVHDHDDNDFETGYARYVLPSWSDANGSYVTKHISEFMFDFDAEFIAHAREDIPYLLNELRASESARQEAERERDALRAQLTALEASLRNDAGEDNDDPYDPAAAYNSGLESAADRLAQILKGQPPDKEP